VDSFSVGTTVVVPDRGAAYIGGVHRSAYGSISRGTPILGRVPGLGPLFRSRATSAIHSSSTVSVSATIIDLQELDQAVLAAAANRRSPPDVLDPDRERRAAKLTAHIRRSAAADGRPIASVADERNSAVRSVSSDDEVRAGFELAKRAEAAGNLGAARCQYRRLVRTAPEPWKQIAARMLSALEEDKKEPKLASISSTR
jgi:hypothetical protein